MEPTCKNDYIIHVRTKLDKFKRDVSMLPFT